MDTKHICKNEYKVKSTINSGCKIMKNEIKVTAGKGLYYDEAKELRKEYAKAVKNGLKEFSMEMQHGQGTGICFFVHNKEKCPFFECIPNVFKLNGEIIDVGSQGVKFEVGDIVSYENQTKYIINNVTLKDKYIEYNISSVNQNNS